MATGEGSRVERESDRLLCCGSEPLHEELKLLINLRLSFFHGDKAVDQA